MKNFGSVLGVLNISVSVVKVVAVGYAVRLSEAENNFGQTSLRAEEVG